MDSRFFSRKAFVISESAFVQVMRELLEDDTLGIDYGHPALSLSGDNDDTCYEEEDIMDTLSDYLNEPIVCITWHQYDCVYLVASLGSSW